MLSNSQECQDLIKSINSDIDRNEGFIKNPEEQYRQRNKYIEILDYAIDNNELYHLYDIWQVFARARQQATRGFFLDLWDIYEEREQKFSGNYQRERDILRYFVAQVNNQFDEILNAEVITAPERWRGHIQELLIKLIWIENEQEMQLERKLLYSMSHLYVYLYPNKSISVKKEKESLMRQLQIAEEAISCKAKENNSSIVLTKVFSNDESSNLQREFTLSFLYLYRFVNHFAVISLKDFVKKVIDSLKEEEFIKQVKQEAGEELLERLLRYWGANSPLMRFFLQEKLNFKFYEYAQPEAIKLPSPYGTDNFVYTIGASGVGKSYFFHAMDYSSKKSKEQLPLSIEYIDASEESGLDRKKWEEGEELKARENHLIYMRSKVRNLCRFTFYEIEDTQITGTKWQSLQGYFDRRLPSAIILVFSTEEKDNLKNYDLLVNLLDDLAKQDERYRNIPIYFIFNKSDQLLAKIQQSQECDQQRLNEFHSYLNAQIELSKNFNFFSLRYQKEVKQIGTLEIVNRTKACCANLTFSNQLNQDIKRVEKIIHSLLNKNFTNLSFIYTCSLFYGNRQYTDLQELWSDLSNFLIKATCEDLKKYYQREFQTKLNRDFQQVDRFYSTAEIRANLEFSKNSEGIDVFELLNETPDPDSQKFQNFKDDFNNLLNIKEINTSDILSFNSGVESAFNDFAKQKNIHSDFLDTALEATLIELGIPIKTSQTEYFYIRELEFIEPKDYDTIWQFDVTSPSVENFLENEEYQQITEKIKQVLWINISNYNNNRGKGDPLRISEDHLKIIIEQLPKQLQLIDIANRNEAFESSIREKFSFSDTLSNKSSLCLIQRGLFDKLDQDLIQGTDRGQTVFDRLCHLIEINQVNQVIDFNQAKKYCQLLSNYLPKHPNKPKYPQFILVKRQKPPSDKIQVEFDDIKIDILKNLAEKLEKQQELLLSLVEILLKNRHELQIFYKGNSGEYKKYISYLYLVKYLLKISESLGFRIERFQEEPDEIIKKISHVYNELSKPESMNLDSIRKEYEEITLSDKWLLFNPKDIKTSREKIATELKTAFNIYTEILKILKLIKYDNEQLKSLSKDIIQKFIVLRANEYNNLLKDYEKQRKMLIIEERVKYLKQSKWIEDLNWLKNSFEEYDFRRNLIDMNREEINEWKERFIRSINELLEKQLFSQGTE
jgi:hypothetical protein